jgi:hypothetical protein
MVGSFRRTVSMADSILSNRASSWDSWCARLEAAQSILPLENHLSDAQANMVLPCSLRATSPISIFSHDETAVLMEWG